MIGGELSLDPEREPVSLIRLTSNKLSQKGLYDHRRDRTNETVTEEILFGDAGCWGWKVSKMFA